MDLIDTHCHLDDPSFDSDREQVLSSCRRVGVTKMVVPAVEAANWDAVLQLCNSHAGLYPALGLHPIYVERHSSEHLRELAARVAQERPLAIGEIGLDYYIKDADQQRQRTLFESQLAIAAEFQLPVLLHCRKAHDHVLAALRRFKLRGGIAHAFNGSLQQAHQYLELGFKLGFGGMLTYERSTRLRTLASSLPLEALVLETDAPDMTVASHRGERNSPEYLPECLAAVAQVRGDDIGRVAAQTTRNALQVLNIH